MNGNLNGAAAVKSNVYRYDSIDEFIAAAAKVPTHVFDRHGTTKKGALAFADEVRRGDPALVSERVKDIAKIATAYANERAFGNVNTMSGGSVSVPRALAGRPDCMRMRTRVERAARSVRVYVGIMGGGAIGEDDMRRRSSAVIGLLDALQSSGIMVDVYAMVEHGVEGRTEGESETPRDHFHVIHVESRPLDLSVSGYLLSSVRFARELGFSLTSHYDPAYNYLFPYHFLSRDYRTATDEYIARLRSALDLDPNDVVLPRLTNYADEPTRDPAGWVMRTMSQITGKEVSQ